jgi:hypothetical protein
VGVVVIAGFLFAANVVSVVVGVALLFQGSFLDWLSKFNRPAMTFFQTLGAWPGGLLLALAATTAATAIGLLRAKQWAWWMAVGLFVVNGCGVVISYFITGDALRSASGVMICTLFLYGLARVRRYCK